MGCSYDPPESVPSPLEITLDEDGFQRERWDLGQHVICRKCGAVVKGSPYQRNWIDQHLKWHRVLEA